MCIRDSGKAASLIALHHGRPELEFYDLKRDPHEQTNLAGRADVVELQQELLAELRAWIKAQGDELTVFHEPLMLDAPSTWVPRK